MKIRPKIYPLCLVVNALLSPSCGHNNENRNIPVEKSINSIPATEVKVVKSEKKKFEYLITASGKIISRHEVRMQFNRIGTVKNLLVRNGQFVVQGQLLTSLDCDAQEIMLERAKISLEEKRLAYTDMMISYNRLKDSVRFETARKNVRISSGVANAELAFKEAKLDYENSFVRARMSGIISGVEYNEGSSVKTGDLACFIHSPKELSVSVMVLEIDALQLKKGMKADIRPIGSDKVYVGTVETINPRVEEDSGLVKITVKLSDQTLAFPGMHVEAIIRLPFDNNIIVPKEAIVIRSGRTVVFTAKDGFAKWNYVVTGRENGSEIEVLEGLQIGDSVIVSNNLQLAHDATITVN